ncbi:hypothetical protein DYB37_002657 [Aphanomyces astaci]|uniref:Uncharacterized protein n=1 Tax=Aphanomyces astaci TaxID=112090 RepID=A0A418DR42_APHAT|nr:hypothetical protein DYB35_000102 [Aphanomyces astaci]RHZ11821.1 hypothetical protein DYB37_002657 [Aphanomyces astaci]
MLSAWPPKVSKYSGEKGRLRNLLEFAEPLDPDDIRDRITLLEITLLNGASVAYAMDFPIEQISLEDLTTARSLVSPKERYLFETMLSGEDPPSIDLDNKNTPVTETGKSLQKFHAHELTNEHTKFWRDCHPDLVPLLTACSRVVKLTLAGMSKDSTLNRQDWIEYCAPKTVLAAFADAQRKINESTSRMNKENVALLRLTGPLVVAYRSKLPSDGTPRPPPIAPAKRDRTPAYTMSMDLSSERTATCETGNFKAETPHAP